MVSSCSMQSNLSGPKMSKKEITKTLNDGCTIQRNKRERYRIDGKRYRTLSSSKGYKKYQEIRKRNLHKMNPIPVCKMKDV